MARKINQILKLIREASAAGRLDDDAASRIRAALEPPTLAERVAASESLHEPPYVAAFPHGDSVLRIRLEKKGRRGGYVVVQKSHRNEEELGSHDNLEAAFQDWHGRLSQACLKAAMDAKLTLPRQTSQCLALMQLTRAFPRGTDLGYFDVTVHWLKEPSDGAADAYPAMHTLVSRSVPPEELELIIREALREFFLAARSAEPRKQPPTPEQIDELFFAVTGVWTSTQGCGTIEESQSSDEVSGREAEMERATEKERQDYFQQAALGIAGKRVITSELASQLLSVPEKRVKELASHGRIGERVHGEYLFTFEELRSFAGQEEELPDGRRIADLPEAEFFEFFDAAEDTTPRDSLRAVFQTWLTARHGWEPETERAGRDFAENVRLRLKRLGLRVRCPDTGKPSLLQFSRSGNSKTGQFYIDHTSDGRRVRSSRSKQLPRLSIVDSH